MGYEKNMSFSFDTKISKAKKNKQTNKHDKLDQASLKGLVYDAILILWGKSKTPSIGSIAVIAYM